MTKGTFTGCPKCGARVTKEKLRRHLNTVHGDGGKRAKPVLPSTPASSVRFPWRAMAVLAVIGAIVFAAGYWFLVREPTSGGPPPGGPPDRYAVVETNLGTMRIHLAMGQAPATATHFMNLVQAGTYDGKEFYRVAYNGIHVIQGGLQSAAGATVDWERTGYPNAAYSIAMARSGDPNQAADRDSASSEFFINVRDNAALDSYTYEYVVFGHVVGGQSVVDQIGSLHGGQSQYDGPPSQTVTIVRVTIES